MTLSDAANCAQIVSIPLAIILWFFTREHLATFWTRKWKVVAVFLIVLTVAGAWQRGWFDWLTTWLNTEVRWPRWQLTLLLCGGFGTAWFMHKIPVWLNSQVNVFQYCSDEIFGVEWQWSYLADKIDTDAISAFCPDITCRCRLRSHILSEYTFMQGPITVECQNCGFKLSFDTSWDELRRRATVEVERRIRTGEYRRRLVSRSLQS
ncbi:MAG TPA: hypothetical protein VK530_11235 [Candidatus Acidoferrum sp.]|nr:hypothetical protein [Candidatus Acidoferrum sp.]